MKKIILVFFTVFLAFQLSACQTYDYTVDEAVIVMNEAITNYRNADSVHLVFTSNFQSLQYNSNDIVDVKLRNMQNDRFLGRVEMTVTENQQTYTALQYYQDGLRYQLRQTSQGTTQDKKAEDKSVFLSLFTSFLKKPIDQTKTRNLQILFDQDQLQVTFELGSTVVEETLFVSNALETVEFATVKVILNHQKTLLSIEVSFNARAQGVLGTYSYQVDFKRINRYVPIVELTKQEKDQYTLNPEENS